MNRVAISIGNINIYWYSIFVLVAMVVASLLIIREAKKNKIKEEEILDFLFWGLIIGVIGARIYYVIFNFDYYKNNIGEIFAIWNGGLAIHGGILAALVFTIIYSKRKS